MTTVRQRQDPIRNIRPAEPSTPAGVSSQPTTDLRPDQGPARHVSDGVDRGSAPGSHVASDRATATDVGTGTSQLGLLAANRLAGDPVQQRREAKIDAAVRHLRSFDRNDDGMITDRRWRGELDGLQDPLARAVYDFANFGNYSGHTSLYGRETRGDVMSGGLGVGYTLRPEHYTSQGFLRDADLDAGVAEIKKRLAGGGPTGDLAHRDLGRIAERAGQQGLVPAGADVHGEIHAATERLLDHLQTRTEHKERATGDGQAKLTLDELFDGPHALPEGSLERLIADEVLRGPAESGQEHWMDFFADGLARTYPDERGEQKGLAGDMLQHYLLVIGKRAKETQYLGQIQAALDG